METINNQTKKPVIIILIIAIVLITGGVIFWIISSTPEPPLVVSPPENGGENGGGQKPVKEIFTLNAIVLSVNAENNFLIVEPTAGGQEIKVIVSNTTRLIKLGFPASVYENPQKGSVTMEEIEIEIIDFQKGKYIFLKSNKNIVGKTELDDIEYIQMGS